MGIVVVLNPAVRRAGAARRALMRVAAELGLPAPLFVETTVDAPGNSQTSDAVASGASGVVAVGGDGTVRHVAESLAGTSVPLGVMPAGTANLFALNIGLPRHNLTAAARVALAGATRAVDLAGVRAHRGRGRPPTEHGFLIVAGLGNDAATLADVAPAAQRVLGWLAYLAAGARHLGSPLIEVRIDGRPQRTWCALVGNVGRLPLGLRVFPDARPDDGLLHTLVLPLRSVWQWPAVAASAIRRRPMEPLRYGTASDLVMTTENATPAQVDGDPIGEVTALEVSIRPAALLVRALAPTTRCD